MTLYPVHVTMTSTYLWQGAKTSYLIHIMMKSTTCAVIRGTCRPRRCRIKSSSHDDVNLLVIGGAVLDDAVVWPLGAGDVLVLVRGEGEEALAVVQSVLSAGVAAWQRRDGGKWVGRGNLKG